MWDFILHTHLVGFSHRLCQRYDRTPTPVAYNNPIKGDIKHPMQVLFAIIFLTKSRFCENLLSEDNSNNTFVYLSPLLGPIFGCKITTNHKSCQ